MSNEYAVYVNTPVAALASATLQVFIQRTRAFKAVLAAIKGLPRRRYVPEGCMWEVPMGDLMLLDAALMGFPVEYQDDVARMRDSQERLVALEREQIVYNRSLNDGGGDPDLGTYEGSSSARHDAAREEAAERLAEAGFPEADIDDFHIETLLRRCSQRQSMSKTASAMFVEYEEHRYQSDRGMDFGMGGY